MALEFRRAHRAWEFTDMNLVSISNAQRAPMPWANWVGSVYHSLPESLYQPRKVPGKFLAFLGRISPEKRVDRATEIARRGGMPIKIAAKVDVVDKDYFDTNIRRLLDDPLVEYIGEVGQREKSEFLGNALALLFPIDWPEPSGLVMIEAMACGTPVFAYRMGSVPEVLDEGVSGYIVDSLDEAVNAVLRVSSLNRKICRQVFEERFSVRRMCSDYVDVYKRLRGETSEEPDLVSQDKGLSLAA